MIIVAFLFYPISIIVGLFMALYRKRPDNLAYSKLDIVSIVFNFALIIPCGLFCLLTSFLSLVIIPSADANSLQTALAYLLAGIYAAAPLLCGIALGLSVSWRKKGRSVAGFFIQFAGAAGIILLIELYKLLEPLHIYWLSLSLN